MQPPAPSSNAPAHPPVVVPYTGNQGMDKIARMHKARAERRAREQTERLANKSDTIGSARERLTLSWMKARHILRESIIQRALEEKRAMQIALEFDWGAFTPIILGREGQRYRLIDGQHRLHGAALASGLGDEVEVPVCIVNDAQSVERQAEVFVKVNDDRRDLTPITLYHDKVLSGVDPVAAGIDRVLKALGLRVPPQAGRNSASGNGDVIAVSTLERIYRAIGEVGLTETLSILRDGFENGEGCFASAFMDAVAGLLSLSGGEIDRERLVTILKRLGVAGLRRAATAQKSTALQTEYLTTLAALHLNYNRRAQRLVLPPINTTSQGGLANVIRSRAQAYRKWVEQQQNA